MTDDEILQRLLALNLARAQAQPLANTALGLAGKLKKPGQKTATVDTTNEAVLSVAAELNPRVGK